MSARSGSRPNINLSGGSKKAKKIFKGGQKLKLPNTPSAAFGTFIDQGNVFNVQKGKRKIDRFIPNTPQSGIESSFGAESFVPSSTQTGKRIGKLFKFGL